MKNVIKKLLRENLLLENQEVLFNFPNDYNFYKSKITYSYRMGAIRPDPNTRNDEWYESKDIITRKYKDVPVKMRQILNKNGSQRGWKIINVGFDNYKLYEIGSNNAIPSTETVREVIDDFYKKFIEFMSKIEVNENTLNDVFDDFEKRVGRKPNKIYEDTLFETANRWMYVLTLNLIDKRKLLKVFMKEGLPINQAIMFFGNIR